MAGPVSRACSGRKGPPLCEAERVAAIHAFRLSRAKMAPVFPAVRGGMKIKKPRDRAMPFGFMHQRAIFRWLRNTAVLLECFAEQGRHEWMKRIH